MSLRIAIDGRTLLDRHPGIGRYLWNLLRALAKVCADGEQLFLLTGESDEGNTRYPVAELEDLGIERVPVKQPLQGLGQKLALPRRLKELGAEVFHAPYYLTVHRPPCPLVLTANDAIGARWPEALPEGIGQRAYRAAAGKALAAASKIVTLSQAARDEIVEHLEADRERIVVIPAAADPELQPATEDDVKEAGERLKLPARYGLHLGSNQPHKNLVRLIEAWAEASSQEPAKGEPSWYLVLAGRHDPRYPEVRKKARALGVDNIRFLGEVAESDLAALYTGAAFFVLPSLWEGFGLPALEAMACGTAVACTRTSSLPAVAAMGAAYFDPEDLPAMTATLTRLIKNGTYREMLSERGAQRAAQFSWEKTAQQTLKVYRQAAAGG